MEATHFCINYSPCSFTQAHHKLTVETWVFPCQIETEYCKIQPDPAHYKSVLLGVIHPGVKLL